MAKMMTKTVFSLALMAMATSLIGCSYEYHKERDQHMNLSTPSMLQTHTPSSDYNTNVQTGSPAYQQGQEIMLSPQPMIIDAQPGPNTQMLGQPGSGPAIMNPSSEVMPDMRMTTEGSYPRSR